MSCHVNNITCHNIKYRVWTCTVWTFGQQALHLAEDAGCLVLLIDARLCQKQADVHVAGVARKARARRAHYVQLTAVVQLLAAEQRQLEPNNTANRAKRQPQSPK